MWDENLLLDEQPLPQTYCKDGVWYFSHLNCHIPLAGERGDRTFMGHYRALCRLYKIGEEPVDERSVYFVGWEGGPIKIGMAEDARFRLRTLQIGCPYVLELLATTTGGLRAELGYHQRFKHLHLRGEWFERAPEIEMEIARLKGAANA